MLALRLWSMALMNYHSSFFYCLFYNDVCLNRLFFPFFLKTIQLPIFRDVGMYLYE